MLKVVFSVLMISTRQYKLKIIKFDLPEEVNCHKALEPCPGTA